jgi:hypothetical protein
MKIFILFLLILISHVDLRRRNDDDIYELEDLFNNKYREKHRPEKEDTLDSTDEEPYIPSSHKHEKEYPSHKKVLEEDNYLNGEDESYPAYSSKSDDLAESTTAANQNDVTQTPSCINQYNIKYEQLIKVKQLKNGAHMIRYVLIDTSPDRNIKGLCMEHCCAEKTCDLAMLSEQRTRVNKFFMFSKILHSISILGRL